MALGLTGRYGVYNITYRMLIDLEPGKLEQLQDELLKIAEADNLIIDIGDDMKGGYIIRWWPNGEADPMLKGPDEEIWYEE